MSRLVAIVSICIAAALTIGAGAQAAAGAIAGHVTLTRVRGTLLPANAYPTRRVNRHKAPPIPEIKNVVVYLKDPGYRGPLPPMHAEMRQEDETFLPHTLVITKGSTVDFPNGDPFFHNVFSLSSAATFNLGRYPRGQSKAQTFNKAGLVKVYCDIHSHMTAAILVLDHPYFVIPEIDGTYTLPDLPPGQYTLVGWHERVGERTTRVRVRAGETTRVDLSLPVEDAEDGR
jgi:hypothetical protein